MVDQWQTRMRSDSYPQLPDVIELRPTNFSSSIANAEKFDSIVAGYMGAALLYISEAETSIRVVRGANLALPPKVGYSLARKPPTRWVLPDSSSTPPERVYVRLQNTSNSEPHYDNDCGSQPITTVEIALPKLSPVRGRLMACMLARFGHRTSPRKWCDRITESCQRAHGEHLGLLNLSESTLLYCRFSRLNSYWRIPHFFLYTAFQVTKRIGISGRHAGAIRFSLARCPSDSGRSRLGRTRRRCELSFSAHRMCAS